MARYLGLRAAQSLLLVLGAVVIVFFSVRLTGDPASLMLPKEASNQQRAAFRAELGLDRPVIAQLMEYVSRALRGDLGESVRSRTPNLSLILERLPATLELAFAALAFALAVAVPLGLAAGMKPGSIVDSFAQTLAFSGQIVPGFVLAMLLILLFAVQWRLFPSFGRDSFASLVLPAVALGFAGLGQLLRLTRAATLEVRRADFVRTATAKGLGPNRVAWRHVLRNAIIPVVSVAGVQFTYLLGGSVYIETVFAWPGLGGLLNDAVRDSDFPLVQAITIFVSLFAIAVQFLTDALYGLLDPRVSSAQ